MSGWIWNPSDDVLLWALNVVLQVGLIAAVALAIGRMLRRSAAARYLLLCSAMMLVLLCPLLAAVVQSTGMGLVSVSVLRKAAGSADAPAATAAAPAVEVVAPQSTTMVPDPIAPWQSDANGPYPGWPPSETNGIPQSIEGETATVVAYPLVSTPADVATPPSSVGGAAASTGWGSMLRTLGRWVLLVWGLGTLTLLTRMAVAWYRLATLLRDAMPVTDRRLTEWFQQLWPALAKRRSSVAPATGTATIC